MVMATTAVSCCRRLRQSLRQKNGGEDAVDGQTPGFCRMRLRLFLLWCWAENRRPRPLGGLQCVS